MPEYNILKEVILRDKPQTWKPKIPIEKILQGPPKKKAKKDSSSNPH